MPGHLLFHACDPADCRQYANVQINSLPLALFLARVLNRTLVLPPLMLFRTQGQHELYLDGGHDQANAYYRSFGEYFNVSRLQDVADVIVWDTFVASHEGALPIDRLWYVQHAGALRAGPEACVELTRKLLHGSGQSGTRVLGSPVSVGHFQCGPVQLNGPHGFETWLRDYAPSRLAAGMPSSLEHVDTLMVLGEWWGSTNYADEAVDPQLLPPPLPSVLINEHLEFNDELHAAAAAFIDAHLSAGYVSVHWRHGDYQQWSKQAPPEVVAAAALAALANMSTPASKDIFLATNCKEVSQIREVERLVTHGGARLVRYFSDGGDGGDRPRAAFIEQLVASRAATFLFTASSFFSHTIVRERRNRKLGPSVSMHGREQRLDFDEMRELVASGVVGIGRGPGSLKVPIFEQPMFAGASVGDKQEL